MQTFHSNILDPIDPSAVGIESGLHPHEPFMVNNSHDLAPGDPSHSAMEAGRGGGIGGEKPGHPPMPVHTSLMGKYAKPSIPTTEEEPKAPSPTGGVISQGDVDESNREDEEEARSHRAAVNSMHEYDNEMESAGQGRQFGTPKSPSDIVDIQKTQEMNTPQNLERRKMQEAPGGREHQ